MVNGIEGSWRYAKERLLKFQGEAKKILFTFGKGK